MDGVAVSEVERVADGVTDGVAVPVAVRVTDDDDESDCVGVPEGVTLGLTPIEREPEGDGVFEEVFDGVIVAEFVLVGDDELVSVPVDTDDPVPDEVPV